MKIAVIVKQTPDTETKAKVNDSGLDTSGVKFILNPYDEFAVEEAIKTKEKFSGTLTVVSLGPARCVDAMRTALAMGADDGIHIECTEDEEKATDSYLVAKALAKAIETKGPFDCVFAGKQAIDGDSLAVPQMVAEFLNWPRATVVSALEWKDEKSLTTKRSADGGTMEVIELNTPCVIAANKALNTPRYASLPGIMKAKQKKIDKVTFADLGLSATDSRIEFSNFEMPPEKAPAKIFNGTADELAEQIVNALHNEAKVI